LRGIDKGIFMDIEASTIDDGAIAEVLNVIAGDFSRPVQLDAYGTLPTASRNRVIALMTVLTPRVGTTE
jgi:hypothetical protein